MSTQLPGGAFPHSNFGVHSEIEVASGSHARRPVAIPTRPDVFQSQLPGISASTPASPGKTASFRLRKYALKLVDSVQCAKSKAQTYFMDASGLTQLCTEAKNDMHRAPATLPNENPIQQMAETFLTQPTRVTRLAANTQIHQDLQALNQKRQGLVVKTATTTQFLTASETKQAALLLSHAGVGPGKVFQMLASQENLDPRIKAILTELKSSGAPTRSLDEAQHLLNQLFGAEGYQISKLAGVGTIGEVYLAKTPQNQPVVIKMLKQSVTEESLMQEWRIAEAVVHQGFTDPKERQYQQNQLKNLYSQWLQELNFTEEAHNAALLAKGAKRYKVAQTLALGALPGAQHPTVMVQEVAPGVSLDDLCKMLKAHQQNPQTYAQAFSDAIARHSWLADPTAWQHQLPSLYRDAFNEQVLLNIQKKTPTVAHGDPHAGNVFIEFNPASRKLEATFIDAGLVSARDAEKAIKHLGLLINMIIGNSHKLARSIVEHADVLPDCEKEVLVQALSNRLDQQLFKARVNLTNNQYNYQFFELLMKEMGISVPEHETTFFKAQMQAMMNYSELSRLVGQENNNYLKSSLPDLAAGLGKLAWQKPRVTLDELLPAGQHLWREGRHAIRNALQFFIAKAR